MINTFPINKRCTFEGIMKLKGENEIFNRTGNHAGLPTSSPTCLHALY